VGIGLRIIRNNDMRPSQILKRIIDLKLRIAHLEATDKDKAEVLESNPYAVNEGYVSRNMELAETYQDELDVWAQTFDELLTNPPIAY
jgi:hypothetical protein